MIIVFIGSNPSIASKSCLPFYGDTKSDMVLQSWINNLNLNGVEVYMSNVFDSKIEGNKPLTTAQIKSSLPELKSKIDIADKVIALGKTAAKALTLLQVDFFEMPHPSPANRVLNDKKYVEKKIRDLQTFIHRSLIS